MRTGLIYIIRNNVNNKVYIGQTTLPLAVRWRHHVKRSEDTTKNYKIYNAIRKYGIEEFQIEVLIGNLRIEELDQKEIELIQEFDSYKSGYNSTPGGDGKYFSDLEEDLIINEYLNGESTIVLGEKYGVSWTTINRILDKNNIGKHVRFSILNHEEFKKDYLDGMPLTSMADKYGCDLKTVTRVRNRLKLPKRLNRSRKSIPKKYDKNLFIEDYSNGMSMSELADKYEVDVNTIRKRRNSLNLKSDRRNLPRKKVNEVEFTEAYNSGLPWVEICKMFGISEGKGSKLRDQLGLKRRRSK